MENLYATRENYAPASGQPAGVIQQVCTPDSLRAYHKLLEAWTACQFCSRYGYGTKTENGTITCDTSSQKPGAALACNALAPKNYCFPFVDGSSPSLAWEPQHSWGSSVYDPVYGTYILWGTWDVDMGRPYFAQDAPFMKAGQNQC